MVTYPDDWCSQTLEEICIPAGLVRGPFGGSLTKSMFLKKGYKVYEQRNAIYKSIKIGDYYISDSKYLELSRFAVAERDFIVSCSGTIGRIYKIPPTSPKGVINQALLKITIDENKCSSDYFYSYFEWCKFQTKITDDTQGGAMKNLVGMSKFRETSIFMPKEINEQQVIASVLTDIDEHIDNLTELIEKKKAIRDGALEDLVSGKTRLDGFNGEWETIPFNQYFTLLPTNTYSREQLSDSGAIGNIHYGDVLIKYGSVLSENDYIPRIIDTSKVNAKQYLKKNDVIIADTAEDEIVGKAVQVGDVNMTLVSGLHTMACRPNYPTADGFLGYYINSNRYHDQILPYVTGIKVSSISKKSIGETELNIPLDIAEQQAIASVLTAMDEEIQSLEIEKAKMIEIKEGAMDDLLTGRVRLKI